MYSKTKKIKTAVLIFLILLIILLGLTGKQIKNSFFLYSFPIQKKFWSLGSNSSNFLNSILKARVLEQENQELREENAKLLQQVGIIHQLQEENKILREALGLDLQKEFQLKLADVVSYSASESAIFINKGSNEGIREGMPVIDEKKVLIGKIQEVGDNFSQVILISDISSSFPVELNNGVVGIVKGKGKPELSLEKIPHNIEVKEGDPVVTISLGGIFPKGLLVGKVKEIKKTDVSPFQTIKVSVLFDINQLKSVFVITQY
ncbi:rod shape-determining protein MreC [bacterium]|nr:rod shape-determining protein MreC [bacterium]